MRLNIVLWREIQCNTIPATGLARDFSVLPDGRIMGLTANDTAFQLLVYDLDQK